MRATLLFVIVLAGCATPVTDSQRRVFYQTIPTCAEAKECEVKWAAARRWVLSNAGFKIQTISPDYIETFNIRDATSTDLWVRVTKEPTSGTVYRILVEAGCNNMFGCVPEAFAAMQSFNDFVNYAKVQK